MYPNVLIYSDGGESSFGEKRRLYHSCLALIVTRSCAHCFIADVSFVQPERSILLPHGGRFSAAVDPNLSRGRCSAYGGRFVPGRGYRGYAGARARGMRLGMRARSVGRFVRFLPSRTHRRFGVNRALPVRWRCAVCAM